MYSERGKRNTVLLSSEEARNRIVGPAGEPRWSRQSWHRVLTGSGLPLTRVGSRIYVPEEALVAWAEGAS